MEAGKSIGVLLFHAPALGLDQAITKGWGYHFECLIISSKFIFSTHIMMCSITESISFEERVDSYQEEEELKMRCNFLKLQS